MGLRDFIAKRREETKIGNEERKQRKEEKKEEQRDVKARYESARQQGRLKGATSAGYERGREEGMRAGEGGVTGTLKGLLSPKPHTETIRTVTGKGRNRRVTTRTRQVKGGGVGNALGFNIGGPSADSFSLGGHPSEGIGIGFGSSGGSRRKKKSDDSWMNDISL